MRGQRLSRGPKKSGVPHLPWGMGLALLLVSLACTGPLQLHARSQSLLPPEIQSVHIEVLSLDSRMAELRLHLVIDNPGSALMVREAKLEWLLDDVPFALSRHRLDTTWPAQRPSIEHPIDVSLSYFALPFSEFSRGQRIEDFQLIVRGELLAESGARRISLPFRGQAPLSRPRDR